MKIKILETVSDIENFSDEWQCLFDTILDNVSIFLSPSWVIAWLKIQPDVTPYIICFYDNKNLVGVSPLYIKSRVFGFIKEVGICGGNYSQYQKLSLCAEEYSKQLFKETVDNVTNHKVADLLIVDFILDYKNLEMTNSERRQSEAEYNLVLDISQDNSEDLTKRSIIRGLHREAKIKIKKLETKGAVSIEIMDATDLKKTNYLNTLFLWKKHWLNKKGIWSSFYHGKGIKFFDQLLETNNTKQNNISGHVLYLDNIPISIAVGFSKQRTYFSYAAAFNPKFSEYSTGTILFSKILDWMNANKFTRYDFLGFPDAYKERFSNEKTLLYDYMLPLTWKGRIAVFLKRMPIKNWTKKFFYKLPLALRKFIIDRLT